MVCFRNKTGLIVRLGGEVHSQASICTCAIFWPWTYIYSWTSFFRSFSRQSDAFSLLIPSEVFVSRLSASPFADAGNGLECSAAVLFTDGQIRGF